MTFVWLNPPLTIFDLLALANNFPKFLFKNIDALIFYEVAFLVAFAFRLTFFVAFSPETNFVFAAVNRDFAPELESTRPLKHTLPKIKLLTLPAKICKFAMFLLKNILRLFATKKVCRGFAGGEFRYTEKRGQTFASLFIINARDFTVLHAAIAFVIADWTRSVCEIVALPERKNLVCRAASKFADLAEFVGF